LAASRLGGGGDSARHAVVGGLGGSMDDKRPALGRDHRDFPEVGIDDDRRTVSPLMIHGIFSIRHGEANREKPIAVGILPRYQFTVSFKF
jgi:hypothetical protein